MDKHSVPERIYVAHITRGIFVIAIWDTYTQFLHNFKQIKIKHRVDHIILLGDFTLCASGATRGYECSTTVCTFALAAGLSHSLSFMPGLVIGGSIFFSSSILQNAMPPIQRKTLYSYYCQPTWLSYFISYFLQSFIGLPPRASTFLFFSFRATKQLTMRLIRF